MKNKENRKNEKEQFGTPGKLYLKHMVEHII